MDGDNKYAEVLKFLKEQRVRTAEDIFGEYLDGKPSIAANAVELTVHNLPTPVMVNDFGGGGNVVPPENLGAIESEVGFPVCCISQWSDEDEGENSLIGHFAHMTKCFGTCLICGYDNGKPAPLSDENAQFLCDVLAFAKILKNRGEL